MTVTARTVAQGSTPAATASAEGATSATAMGATGATAIKAAGATVVEGATAIERPVEDPGPAPVPVRAATALRLLLQMLDARPLLIVSDFDGTLSPIVMDPWAAAILPLARRALRSLAGAAGVQVVILSGRTAHDVAQRVRVGGAVYLGNHGIERGTLARRQRSRSLRVAAEVSPQIYAETAERLAAGVPLLIDERWLIVERKSPAVAFHFRGAPDTAAAGREVLAAVDRLDPAGVMVRFSGRRVLELRPVGATAKGEAVAALLDQLHPAVTLVLGDDRSDALAFAVLRAARDAGATTGLAIAVQAHAEAPRDVADAADVLLASPLEAARLLAAVARRVA